MTSAENYKAFTRQSCLMTSKAVEDSKLNNLCLCGCGGKTEHSKIHGKRNIYNKFIHGHNSHHPLTAQAKMKLSTSRMGENNPYWKGKDIKYYSLHEWLNKYLPKPDKCPRCGNKKRLDLCNISQKYNPETYNRNPGNWFYACRKCHIRYDNPFPRRNPIQYLKSWETRRRKSQT